MRPRDFVEPSRKVVYVAVEQMPVGVEAEARGAVAEDRLQRLWRRAGRDEARSRGVTQHIDADR